MFGITSSNFILIVTGSLLPLICAKFHGGILLNTYNTYLIAIICASVLDSFQIIQMEYIYSNANFIRLKLLTKNILSRKLALLMVAFPLVIGEFLIFNTFFLIVIFSKHVFNDARVVYVLGLNSNSLIIKLNIFGSVRNILLCVSAYFSDSIYLLVLSISLISLFEMILIFYLVLSYYEIKLDGKDIRLPNYFALFNKSIRSIRVFDISLSAFLNTFDRILILVFDPIIQISYLKYKVIQQYIDGVFSVFAYKLHVMQMKTRKFPSFSVVISILSILTLCGFAASIYLMSVETMLSYVVLFILCILLSLRRVFDGVSGAHLRSIKKYKTIIFKNLFETVVILIGFVLSYNFLSDSADKIFILYIIFSLSSMIYLYLSFYKKLFRE